VRYHVLAADYDGTLAHHGQVDQPTLAALERVLASGRKLVMVTGRRMAELVTVFDHLELFEWIVAENGALLYKPSSGESRPIVDPPPPKFVEELARRGVAPIDVGEVIVATWEPHEAQVLEVIRDLGLELQIIFNKGAVMVLPAGINKAVGLAAALTAMQLSPHNVVAIGDAENDHALLSLAECSVAVANALDSVKKAADVVTSGDHGRGVAELIDMLVTDDLKELEPRLARHQLRLGKDEHDAPVQIPSVDVNILVAGASGSGKSTIATGLLEQMAEHKYQFLVIDPEGDYEVFEQATTLGGSGRAPTIDEVLALESNPRQNIVVNLMGVPVVDRPLFFLALLPRLHELRARTGRPHWVVIDEAHHVLPASWRPGELALPQELDRYVLISIAPKLIAPGALRAINHVVVAGETSASMLSEFAEVTSTRAPGGDVKLDSGQALLWRPAAQAEPRLFKMEPSRTERRRHSRKYALGELPPDRSFYFRGPDGKLNLRAQNLSVFLQMAEGVGDDTWLHHLRAHDYSQWFRERIKDSELADEAAQIESRHELSAADSRTQIRAAIEARYSSGGSAPVPIPGTDAAGQFHQQDAPKAS
jgi:hydroxymethylpyrimidine pyrophosphatase-like HAD family hydrolase